MKAMIQTGYGSPEVLELQEQTTPTPLANEVLVRVQASSVTVVDAEFRRGESLLVRMFTGLSKPNNNIQGGDFAGEVVEVGSEVTRFHKGDKVYGAMKDGAGAHSEFICIPEDEAIAEMPSNLGFTEAGAIPYGALTALPFLRDEAQLQPGQSILILGASGGVGSMAVQLAKYMGAEVTGVCSTRNVEFVKSLGADVVLDYKKEDFTKSERKWDVIFDLAGKSSYSQCKRLLTDHGKYMTAVLSIGVLFQMFWTSSFSKKKALIAFTGLRKAEEKVKDLQFLSELVEQGDLKPVVGKNYTMAEIPEAHRLLEAGGAAGSVVIQMTA